MSAEIRSYKQKYQTLCFTSLDDFKVANVLSASRRGRVMIAAYLQTGLLVMLKERYLAQDTDFGDVLREAELLLDLGPHCNIISILGYARVGTNGLIAFEHLQHGDLAKQVQRYKSAFQAFSEEFLWAALLDVSSALKHIHSCGYVFRDVRLSNIYLREVDYTNTASLKLTIIEPSKNSRLANIQFVLSGFEACRKVPQYVCDASKLASGQLIPSKSESRNSSLLDDEVEYTPGVEHIIPNPNSIMRPPACQYKDPTISFLQAVQQRFYYDTEDESSRESSKVVRSPVSYAEDQTLPYSARTSNKYMTMRKEFEGIVRNVSESSVMNPEVREELRASSRSGSRCESRHGSRSTSRNASRSASPSLPLPRSISLTADSAVSIPINNQMDGLFTGSCIKSISPPFRRGLTDISNIPRPDTSEPPSQSDSPRTRRGTSSRASVSTRSQNSIDHGKFDYVQNMARFAKIDPFERAIRNHKIRKELEKRRKVLSAGVVVSEAEFPKQGTLSSKLTVGKFGTQSIAQAMVSRPATASTTTSERQSRRWPESPLRQRSFQTKVQVPLIVDEEEQLRQLEELWRREEVACNPDNPNYPARLSTTLDQCSPRARDALPPSLEGHHESYSNFKAKIQRITLPGGSNTLTVLGTPNYMPKEMTEGKNTTSMDIYALGASMLELMCLDSYSQIDIAAVQKALAKQYSEELRTIVLRMLGPPHLRPTAEEVYELCLKAVKGMHDSYGKSATLTYDDVVYERGCKMIPFLKHPLHVDLETTHLKTYLRQRSPYAPKWDIPDDVAEVVAPHIREQMPEKEILAGIRHMPPQVCSLKPHKKPTYVEYNNEWRTVDHVELPLHRTSCRRPKMSEYLEQLNKLKPPLYEHSKATSRKIVDEPEKWMPSAASVLSEFGPEAQLRRLQAEETPETLEILDPRVYSIPNAHGGRRIPIEKASSTPARPIALVPKKASSSGMSTESSRERSANRSKRPYVSVTFGTMPVTEKS